MDTPDTSNTSDSLPYIVLSPCVLILAYIFYAAASISPLSAPERAPKSPSKPEQCRVHSALGGVVGACVGEQAGKAVGGQDTVQFEQVRQAMKFQGEDMAAIAKLENQMALVLMETLEKHGPRKENMAYVDWYDNCEVEVPKEIKKAIKVLRKVKDGQITIDQALQEIKDGSKRVFTSSCLKRAIAMGIYCYQLSDEEIYACTKMDVELTHGEELASLVVTCYNIAIAHMLKYFGDCSGAIERVHDYVIKVENNDLIEYWNKIVQANNDTDLNLTDLPSDSIIIPFSYAFFYLKNGYTYKYAIKEVLLKGGDTETNAAIVGGLLGLKGGIKMIPISYRNKVLNSELNKENKSSLKSAKALFKQVELLLQSAPSKIE